MKQNASSKPGIRTRVGSDEQDALAGAEGEMPTGHGIVLDSVDRRSWTIGFDAGHSYLPSTPVPPGVDRLAWHLGWRRGRARRFQATH